MKPAPLRLRLAKYMFISHIHIYCTAWDIFLCPLSSTLSGKRRFKCVIITSIYTHKEMDPHYHSISNMSQHVLRASKKYWFSIFVTLDMIRDGVFFSPEVWIEESKQSTDQEERLLYIFQQCLVDKESSKQRSIICCSLVALTQFLM